jgi:L-fucose isomerase-like protein
MKKKLVLGFLPTRRDLSGEYFCSVPAALSRKNQVEARLKTLGVEFVSIDFLNDEGILRNGADARKVAEYFTAQGVGAVFAPHVNFGCEDAVAKVAKLMNKPLLLWGPRDDAPDGRGNRCTDSQCGLFATGKVLQQFGAAFTYMTNCRLTDPLFPRVLMNFLAAAHVAQSFRGMRVGQIGVRPETFWSVKCNELQLLERFGIEVVPITLLELQNLYRDFLQNHQADAQAEADRYKAQFTLQGPVDGDALLRTAAMAGAIRRWAESYALDAVASNCWEAMRQIGGINTCFVFGELTEHQLPVTCEMDIHGAISSVMAQAASRWQVRSFLADITTRHPTDDNAELFWHCGNFPRSAAAKDPRPAIGASFDGDLPTVGNFRLGEGPVTITRFDCGGDQYRLLIAAGRTVDGPGTTGTFGWVAFKDWPALEHKLVTGPYIHHCAGILAEVAPALYEACRYIPGLTADPVEPTAQEIEQWLR